MIAAKEMLFGVASADHQCEAFDPERPDVWDWWEASGKVPQVRGRATDFWNRFEEDVELARGLGCSAFRFSIAWSRVEPRPGEPDSRALDHYASVVDCIRRHGMTPVVTLLHMAWPLHVQERGGLLAPEFPGWFRRYAGWVGEALGGKVPYWLTFNEPDGLITDGFTSLGAAFPPGPRPNGTFAEMMADVRRAMTAIFLAHSAARDALRSGPGGETNLVSANTYANGLPIWIQQILDAIPAGLVEHHVQNEQHFLEWFAEHGSRPLGAYSGFESGRWEATNRRFGLLGSVTSDLLQHLRSLTEQGIGRALTVEMALFEANWFEMGMLGQLPAFLCPTECHIALDYAAFDFYFAVPHVWSVGAFERLATVGRRRFFEQAPVYAPRLYESLRYEQSLFPGLPIMIMENGIVNQRSASAQLGKAPAADAVEMAEYVAEHVDQVARARADGVNVQGYHVWSITSNREWGLPFDQRSDFGLYHVDLDHDPTLRRVETSAASVYRGIIRRLRSAER
ncbi:MAG TPA: family 1 glycosylhydrolase [Chloroflexota bacterium]|nr:family 1 glycosylhydrolase [Chloroflexota bacterium]